VTPPFLVFVDRSSVTFAVAPVRIEAITLTHAGRSVISRHIGDRSWRIAEPAQAPRWTVRLVDGTLIKDVRFWNPRPCLEWTDELAEDEITRILVMLSTPDWEPCPRPEPAG